MTSFSSKIAARKEASVRIAGMGEREKQDASTAIRRNIDGWSRYRSAKYVLLFAGMACEPDLLPLLEREDGGGGLRDGTRHCFPRVSNGGIEIYAVGHSSELFPGKFGILEPDFERAEWIAPEAIDLALVPGVAFGLGGERVGRGRGYFDRFLPGLRQGATVAGVCFGCQIFGSLPVEAHDYPVGFILSEEGVREV